MKYGSLPKVIGTFEVPSGEMFFYQYLPIKFPGSTDIRHEDRLKCFEKIIGAAACDFVGEYGLNGFVDSYVYLTAKRLYVHAGCPFNRPGYHSDGFMTSDINYVWSDCDPTIFNTSEFEISMNDKLSMREMELQALEENEVRFPDNSLLRLDQTCIHKVSGEFDGVRTFLKLSFSGDKYDLIGNSHNYRFSYNWIMRPRTKDRNIPQNITK